MPGTAHADGPPRPARLSPALSRLLGEPAARAAHRSALDGAPAEYPLHRDGRDYEVRVEPLRDAAGAIIGCLGLGVDVTERARAAAALRDSEARFRALFEGAAIGIGLADLDRRPLMVNPALARLTSRDGAEADGHGLGRSTHPEDAARDKALFAELVAGRRDHYQIEKRYLRPDGTTAWGRLTTSLVRDAGGAPQYAIGMVEDITARVEAEESLREASELSPRRRDRFELPHVAGKLRPTTHTHARMTVRSTVSFPTFRPTWPRFGSRGLSSDTSIYEAANDTNKSLKVICYFSDTELAKVQNILRELGHEDNPGIILIDARMDNKPSASKA